MSTPSNIAAYAREQELFQKALVSEKPFKVRPEAGGKGMLVNLRQRCYALRILDRKQSSRIYEKDDPRWAKSHYDKVVISLLEDEQGHYLLFSTADQSTEGLFRIEE